MESTGKPSPEDVQSIKSPFAGTMLESIPPTRQISLNEVFSGASVQALDLMSQCLHFNPDKRVRAADALKHPYVAEFHNPDDEPDYPHGTIQVGAARDPRDVNMRIICLQTTVRKTRRRAFKNIISGYVRWKPRTTHVPKLALLLNSIRSDLRAYHHHHVI